MKANSLRRRRRKLIMASVKFKLQDQQQLQWEMFHNVPPKTKELTVLKVSDKTS